MFKRLILAVLTTTLAAGFVASAQADPGNGNAFGHGHAMPAHSQKPVCGPPSHDTAQCNAHVVTQSDGATPLASASYTYGFSPADLTTAYGIGAGAGTPTVAIVDAYDNPKAETDLAAYRSQFGLPACT